MHKMHLANLDACNICAFEFTEFTASRSGWTDWSSGYVVGPAGDLAAVSL